MEIAGCAKAKQVSMIVSFACPVRDAMGNTTLAIGPSFDKYVILAGGPFVCELTLVGTIHMWLSC